MQIVAAPSINPGYSREHIFLYALFSILLIVVIIIIYIYFERKKQQKLRQKFLKFSSTYQISVVEKRFSQRMPIPQFLNTEIMFTEGDYFGLRGTVIDISDSGLAIKPDFPLKKIPLQKTFENVILHTPLADIVLKKISSVRIEHQQNKRLLGLQIAELSQDQQEKFLSFLHYLRGFLANEQKNH